MSVTLPITSFIALPMTILMVGLAYRVAILRRKNKIGIGVSSNKTLAKAMAAHSNAVENIPLALILFALVEFQGANVVLLSTCAVVFVTARCLNALGVSQHAGNSFGRFYGIILNWMVIILLAFANLWLNLL